MAIHNLRFLITQSSYSVAARSFGALAQLVMTYVIARALGVEGTGDLFLALNLAVFLSIIARLGFDNIALREAAFASRVSDESALLGVYRESVVVALLGSAVLILLVELIGIRVLSYFSLDSIVIESIKYAVLAIAGISVSVMVGQVLKGSRKTTLGVFVEFSLWRVFVMAAFVAGWYLDVSDVQVFSQYFALAAFFSGVFSLMILVPYLVNTNVFPKYNFSKHLASARSMFVTRLIQQYFAWGDVIIVGMIATSKEVGVYVAASRLASVISFILQGVNGAIGPRIASAHKEDSLNDLRALLHRSILISTVSALPIAAVFFGFGDSLLSLFGNDFTAGYMVLVILAMAQLINAITGPVGLALLLGGKEQIYERIHVIAAVANLLLMYTLTIHFGVEGAAIATAVSIVLINLAAMFVVQREIGLWGRATDKVSS